MTLTADTKLRQRSDFTHKYNAKTGRHGWLRLTPAYSLKVVEEIISHYPTPMAVLDPFCGTGTTALSAAYHGHLGITTDINPFLVWLGRAKTFSYLPEHLERAAELSARLDRLFNTNGDSVVVAPKIANIDRWWGALELAFLRQLKTAIIRAEPVDSPVRDLLLIAFCRTLITLSNASFGHQSMSFKSPDQLALPLDHDLVEVFRRDLFFVLDGATENPSGSAQVILGDARCLAELDQMRFDAVITSPPYANRMSYIRELRPYMYWLDFLESGRHAGELDWNAIGGTWGVATSNLSTWRAPANPFRTPHLSEAIEHIADASNRNGGLLARYVDKYFCDMWDHFRSLTKFLKSGAVIHYIVGNSTFYDNLLSVELVYCDMLKALGFGDIKCQAIRKRNSKKELIEFDVSAVWPG